ncbi:MAG: glycosyl transferase family 1, partial [Pseudomonadota bacterium]
MADGNDAQRATGQGTGREPATTKKIVLISTNFGQNMGGEAIKAYQYAKYLEANGYDFLIVTHGRCRAELEGEFPPERFWIIEDDWAQRLLWRSVILRTWLNIRFHALVRRRIMAAGLDPKTHILHFIGPVSPVAVRLPAPGFETVMGPFTGNIYYPPAFKHRMPPKDRLREGLHVVAQWSYGKIFGDKKRAKAVLVSGYERTRASLRLAGCGEDQMIDVVDAGVSDDICALPRVSHEGENKTFMCSGRMVDHKGVDLAIKALATCPDDIRLDVFG